MALDLGPGLTIVRGPNGAGKTTLLRAIAGLVPLARGTRSVSAPPLYLGHRPMLLRGLTARENLEFFVRFTGSAPADAAPVLRTWGIDDQDRPVERLSAGQRRRVSLARLDLELAPVALLDEPFADLDAQGLDRVRHALEAAVARGHAILLATHLHETIDALASSVVIVEHGELRPA